MREREEYYKSFILELVRKHYDIELNPIKSSEAKLPKVKIDLQFEIPKEALKDGKCPLPFQTELNLVHIKAVNDRLTEEDFRIYLAQLAIVAEKEKENKKEKKQVPRTTGLLIFSAEEIAKKGYSRIHTIQQTKIPWILQIKHDHPAFLFILERLPFTKMYREFLPFMTVKRLNEAKKELHELQREAKTDKDKLFLMMCLKKLQPDFYEQEFGMSLLPDTKEMAKEFFPKGFEQAKTEGILEGEAKGKAKGKAEGKAEGKVELGRELILEHLKDRFKKGIFGEIENQLNNIHSLEELKMLLKEAEKAKDLIAFEKTLKKLAKKRSK